MYPLLCNLHLGLPGQLDVLACGLWSTFAASLDPTSKNNLCFVRRKTRCCFTLHSIDDIDDRNVRTPQLAFNALMIVQAFDASVACLSTVVLSFSVFVVGP